MLPSFQGEYDNTLTDRESAFVLWQAADDWIYREAKVSAPYWRAALTELAGRYPATLMCGISRDICRCSTSEITGRNLSISD